MQADELIPAEAADNYESWHMPVLQSAGNAPTIVARKPPESPRSEMEDLLRKPLTVSRIEEIREQVRQQGLAEGREQGYREGIAQAQQSLAQLNQIIGQLAQPLSDQQQDIEQALLVLATRTAETVTKSHLQMTPEALLDIIRQALAQLDEVAQQVRVMVNPQDLEMLNGLARDQSPTQEDWKLFADASLSRGGCVVKTAGSYIDFTLETRFQLVLQELLQQHANTETGEASLSSPTSSPTSTDSPTQPTDNN